MNWLRFEKANRKAVKRFYAYQHFNPKAPRGYFSKFYTGEDINRILGIYRKVTKPCSCWMCSNRRAYNGVTLGEYKQLLELRQQLDELDIAHETTEYKNWW